MRAQVPAVGGGDHYGNAAWWATSFTGFAASDPYALQYAVPGIREYTKSYNMHGICPQGTMCKGPSHVDDRDWIGRDCLNRWSEKRTGLLEWKFDYDCGHYHWSHDGVVWCCPKKAGQQ